MNLCLTLMCTWSHAPGAFAASPFDVAIVPGCPANDDGTVSDCQYKRASWAAALFHGGSVEHLVVSGAAVYNPFVEAEGLSLALQHLGVPADAIVVEDQARHSDENLAYSLALIEDRGWERIAVVSYGAHAVLIDEMAAGWGIDVTGIPLVEAPVSETPHLQMTARADWQSPDQVDARSAPSASLPKYIWHAVSSRWLDHQPTI